MSRAEENRLLADFGPIILLVFDHINQGFYL